MKIKILHFINWLNPGGVEKQLLSIIENYNRDKFRMDICCIGNGLGIMIDKFKKNDYLARI